MKYRVWCDDFDSIGDGVAVEASSAKDAARKHLSNIDTLGDAFPDEEDRSECTIRVCPWTDIDDSNEDAEEPDSEAFTFRLSITRSVILK